MVRRDGARLVKRSHAARLLHPPPPLGTAVSPVDSANCLHRRQDPSSSFAIIRQYLARPQAINCPAPAINDPHYYSREPVNRSLLPSTANHYIQ